MLADKTTLDFPKIDRTDVGEHEDTDGFIMVRLRAGVKFRGLEEVQEGLSEMLDNIVVIDA